MRQLSLLLAAALALLRVGSADTSADVCAEPSCASGGSGDDELFVTLSNGVKMPRMGFGLAGMKGQDTRKSVRAHLQQGFRMLDGAEATEWYDDAAAAEELARTGKELGLTRKDVFIMTKVHPKNLGADATRKAVLRMLKRWNNTEYLDVVLLHYLECTEYIEGCAGLAGGDWQGSWRALEQLYAEGKVKAIGASNVIGKLAMDNLFQWAKVRPHVIQNHFDPFRQWKDEYQYARDEGAAYVAYSSLGSQWSSMDWVNKNLVLESKILAGIALNHSTTVPAVVLAWQLSIPRVVVIPRSTNPEHIKQNARFLKRGYGFLSQNETHRIAELDDKYDIGDEQECQHMKKSGQCVAENEFVDRCLATCQETDW